MAISKTEAKIISDLLLSGQYIADNVEENALILKFIKKVDYCVVLKGYKLLAIMTRKKWREQMNSDGDTLAKAWSVVTM